MDRYTRAPHTRQSGKNLSPWHLVDDLGRPRCHRNKVGIAGTWTFSDRLPRRSEPHCRICFPGHDPGETVDYRPDDWTGQLITNATKGST